MYNVNTNDGNKNVSKKGDGRKYKGLRPTPFLIAEQEAIETGKPLFTMSSLRNTDSKSKKEIEKMMEAQSMEIPKSMTNARTSMQMVRSSSQSNQVQAQGQGEAKDEHTPKGFINLD